MAADLLGPICEHTWLRTQICAHCQGHEAWFDPKPTHREEEY